MIILNRGILLNLYDITSVKKICIDEIKCYRLEIHYHHDVVSFDYLSENELILDYDLIIKNLNETFSY